MTATGPLKYPISILYCIFENIKRFLIIATDMTYKYRIRFIR